MYYLLYERTMRVLFKNIGFILVLRLGQGFNIFNDILSSNQRKTRFSISKMIVTLIENSDISA